MPKVGTAETVPAVLLDPALFIQCNVPVYSSAVPDYMHGAMGKVSCSTTIL